MKKNTLVISAMALSMTANASANEPVDSTKTYELQSVQVTSTRATNKTPMAYTDLDKKAIQKVNFGQDIPYILSLTPSVTVTSDAGNGIGYTSIRVRGVDPSRINITANGIPMNDAESSQVYFVNIGDFASSVQNMQIQRGAGTSTNGSGAFGATINMQTDNIGTEPFFGLDASGGSYYSHKESLRFGTGLLGGHWGIQGRLSNIGSKGYLRRASTKLNSYFVQAGYFSDNTMVKFITFNGIEQTYHAWNYTSKYEQSVYGRRYNSCGYMYTDENGANHYYDGQNDNYHQQNYQLIWNQILNRNFNLNAALHYTKGQGYYEEYKRSREMAEYSLVPLAEYGLYYSDLVRQKKMDNDLYGAIASINYNNFNGLKATLGGGWNKYDGDHFGYVTWVKNPVAEYYPNHKYYDNNALKSDFNVYGKVSWEFLKGLNAYADLQYRHVGYRLQDPEDNAWADQSGKYIIHDDFDFFNPKAGINYQLNDNNRIYASYALSHKEPVRNDYQDNGVTHLKPETLHDFELGYKFQSSTIAAGINLYYMLYKDQYVLTGQLNDIGEMIASNENSGKSYRTGMELEAAWKPADWFRWDINATFATSKTKDWTITTSDGETINLGDTHISFTPDVIFNNILTFSYKGLNASIQSQYIGEQYLTNTGFKSYNNYNEDGSFDQKVSMMLDDHFTTNIDLSYNFSLKKLGIKDATLGVTLYNIFSAEYDNNGWAYSNFRKDATGKIEAYNTDDLYEAGFAPSAPFNCMAHMSINF